MNDAKYRKLVSTLVPPPPAEDMTQLFAAQKLIFAQVMARSVELRQLSAIEISYAKIVAKDLEITVRKTVALSRKEEEIMHFWQHGLSSKEIGTATTSNVLTRFSEFRFTHLKLLYCGFRANIHRNRIHLICCTGLHFDVEMNLLSGTQPS